MTWLLDRAPLSKLLKLAPLATLVIVAGCHDTVQPAKDPTITENFIPPPPPTDDEGSHGPPGGQSATASSSTRILRSSPWKLRAIVERQVAFAKQHPNVTFTIEGHCDERGTSEYNLAIGERRAEADRTAWVALGIDPARLHTVSYGKERPAAIGHDAAAWAQNRRAVSVIN